MSIRSVTSVRAVSTNLRRRRSARTSGRNLYGVNAGAGQDRVKGCSELPCTVADEEPKVRSVVAGVHEQIADLLGGPQPVRVRGDPEDMDVAAADFDDEEAVQAPEGHAVHVEEVGGKHRGGLRVQELAPGCVGVPLGCRRYLQGLENPSDGGRADLVAELEKLALNALIPPRGVLGGESLDQRGDLGTDRRSARPVRIGPFPGDQAAVLPEHGAGCDQPGHVQALAGRSRISAARTARSAQSSRALGVARRSTATSCRSTSSSTSLEAGAAEQDQPAAKPDEDQVEQAKGHGRSSCPTADRGASMQLTDQAHFWHPTGALVVLG